MRKIYFTNVVKIVKSRYFILMETFTRKNIFYHSHQFTFAGLTSSIYITKDIPSLEDVIGSNTFDSQKILLICDEHTRYIAERICKEKKIPTAVLPAGEEHKNWVSVERILEKAKDHGLGRDSLFVGIGGGVVSDMASFAASIYMRGTGIALISTSLLGMVDAAAGGKTGFDLFSIKNLAGTFYPAEKIFMPLEALTTLPQKEWKSGLAELIKTAVIGNRNMLNDLELHRGILKPDGIAENPELLARFISKSVEIKCRIVESDPQEKGSQRMLLNLGHTFGHALESSLGLGSVTHGEAVAWGTARSCELGLALGLTDKTVHDQIIRVLESFGFEIRSPHPEMQNKDSFMNALMNDKKKKNGSLSYIIPDAEGARIITSDAVPIQLLKEIIGIA